MNTPGDLRLNPLAINKQADGTSGSNWVRLAEKGYNIKLTGHSVVSVCLAAYDDEEFDVESSGALRELDPRDRDIVS